MEGTPSSPASNSCFLCDPDLDLVYCSHEEGIALAGLGPLVPGYSVLATRRHVASAADAVVNSPVAFPAFVERVRAGLSRRYGDCLMTEHGRVPVCADVSGTSDPHCFHAHFLLFPGAPSVLERAQSHFAVIQVASSLAEALDVCGDLGEYFLFSLDEKHFSVMTRPGKLIRQFARFIIADALGRPAEASWRRNPSRREAAATAAALRDPTGGEI